MIRAVLFDLDNTLIDDDASTRRAIAAACEEAAELVPGLGAEQLGEAYWNVSLEIWGALAAELNNGRSAKGITGAEFRRLCWSKALAACGVTDGAVVGRVVESYSHWRERELKPFPEVEEMLAALRGRAKVGIVTNGTADTHRRKLELLGYDESFDCCIVAGEFGPAKPDPAIFVHTAERLSVRPEECLMVGDNPEADVAGAKAAGMKAVWFRREIWPLPEGCPPPDYEISDLREIVAMLDREGWGMMKPRAILFDLGNTLLHYSLHGHWREFLTEQLEVVYETVCDGAASRHVSPQVFATVASEVIGGDKSHQLRSSGRSWPFVARLREAMAGLDLTCDDSRVAEVITAFYAPIRACTSLYSDTVPVLEGLKTRGMPLAIVSDTPWDVPGSFCLGDMQKWGIDGYFQATVFSGDRPWRKPSPEVLRAAAQELGVPLESCVAIGDTLAAEIAAANAAGILSVWIDRTGEQQPWEGAQPTAMARSLTEAVELAS